MPTSYPLRELPTYEMLLVLMLTLNGWAGCLT